MIPSVLFFHQVVRTARPEHFALSGATTLDRFREMMIELKEHYHPLKMDEFVWSYQHDRKFPARSVLITFDDGFKNNLWAAEILHELGLEATIFVVSGAVDTGFQPWYVRFAELISARCEQTWTCSWGSVDYGDQFSRRRWLKKTKEHLLSLSPADRDAALEELAEALGLAGHEFSDPDLAFVGADDIRRLVELGMVIGAHSRTHDNLAACQGARLRSETVECGDELEQWTGRPVRYFCYPDGRYGPQTLELVRGRFDAAFTIEARYRAPDIWRFPRRGADGGADLGKALGPWYPLRRGLIDATKRVLRF